MEYRFRFCGRMAVPKRILHILAVCVLTTFASSNLAEATDQYGGVLYVREGDSYRDLFAWINAQIYMSGGEVTNMLMTEDSSMVSMTGGMVFIMLGRGHSTINFSGGHVTYFTGDADSVVNITGGRIRKLESDRNGTVNVMGGDELQVSSLRTMHQSSIFTAMASSSTGSN